MGRNLLNIIFSLTGHLNTLRNLRYQVFLMYKLCIFVTFNVNETLSDCP